MITTEAPFRLFGTISMTPALWWFVAIQLLILLIAFVLSLAPMPNRVSAKRLGRVGTAALLASVATSAFTYLSALVSSFALEGPPSEVAARLATDITTMMHVRWMALVCVVLVGITIKIQDARRASLAPPTA